MSTRQTGMSLAELMIAMALGLMLTLGIATLFSQSRQSFNQDEQIATMQANLRFAMEMLVRDAAMAGFWGGLLDPVGVTLDSTLDVDPDCGAGGGDWVYEALDSPLGGLNNTTAAAANAAFGCIEVAEFRPATDVISIKRTLGNAIPDDPNNCVHDFGGGQAVADGTVYLAENGINGLLFEAPPSGATVITGCVENRQYAPVIYYVRNFSVAAGDGIPTLCRKVLEMSDPPGMETECLVEGIEQLQVEYGIDTDSDGAANRYLSAPSAAQYDQVTAVRLHLLVRSLRPEPGYTNPKTYILADTTVTPADNFYRRAATTTVVLRNPANLRNLGN